LGEDGRHSALGEQRIYQVERALKARETELKNAGKNPRDLYDPSTKEFFGAPANIRRYQVSLQDAQKYQDQIGKPAAAPEPTAPGVPAPASAATPEKAAAVAAQPIRAVNRTTGQALVLQNNQWVPEIIAPQVPMRQ